MSIRSAVASLGLVVGFALLAALSTLAIWVLLSLPTAEPLAIDSLGFLSLAAGALGPILVFMLVRRATRATAMPMQRTLRVTSTVGSALVLVIEVLYLIPLGIVFLAYSGVRM